MKTSLEKFMAGLQRLVESAKDKTCPTVVESAEAVKEHAALVAVAQAADRVINGRGSRGHVDLYAALTALAAVRQNGGGR